MSVSLKIPGNRLSATDGSLPQPTLLSRESRSATGQDDVFLPGDYVKVAHVFELKAAVRAPDAQPAPPVVLDDDDVVLLEMADGVTVVTSAAKLHQTLARLESETPSRALDGASASDGATPSLDVLAQRGAATRSGFDSLARLATRVFALKVGQTGDAIVQEAKQKALEWARVKGGEELVKFVEGGPSRLGTKALMWAIERRLGREPGLYRFRGARDKPVDLQAVDAATLANDVAAGPLLVFVHGTASNTAGSFADLAASTELFRTLERRFGERIYAFEHRTLSESPIENALQLVSLLPNGARVSLVTHSRGGLVGDLLCARNFDSLVPDFGTHLLLAGVEGTPARDERPDVYAEQRADLMRLSALLKERQLAVERYVRVACPARGTRLASGNFDVFLSGLLSSIALVPALGGSPLYAAFKRVVLEIAKNRARPELVPGLEAMLPESPLAELLRRTEAHKDLAMAVIAGDIEGGGLLKRLGVFFTDFMFFDREDNDLVVDTDSMYAGIAPASGARALFEQGPHVSHFRYFANERSRKAVVAWLTDQNLSAIADFTDLPGAVREPTQEQVAARQQRSVLRSSNAPALPVVVVLPGIMGSHLWVNRRNRVWFDVTDLVYGGLEKVSWIQQGVEAESLFDHFYGDLCEHLEQTHVVERFPYDWRQPLDVLADSLNAALAPLLARSAATQAPVRLLAHSMGGLVVRALAHRHPDTYEALMKRDGARFIMLGTPNQGSHAMVESLLGKSTMIRMLARADLKNGLQGVLDVVGEFRGALQLLPRPGFQDSGGAQLDDYFDPATWRAITPNLHDFWFGSGVCAQPSLAALQQGAWLWKRDAGAPTLDPRFQEKTIYVYGSSPSTPAGLTRINGAWKMVASTRGDGSVTWDSGTIGGIGPHFFMPAEHGALASTGRYFEAISELLGRGSTSGLPTSAPAKRASETSDSPVAYDAGPPLYPTPADIGGGFFGQAGKPQARPRDLPCLRIRVRAMDLRWVDHAVMVGHYAEDPISGAEALIDKELVGGELSLRKNLGLYAGAVGTATVVLHQNALEKRRGTASGAVVTGLGPYDGSLSSTALRDAVRAGVLRYLLHVKDCSAVLGKDGNSVPLSSVLLGYNSSANLSISDSVATIVRGVIEANRKFDETTESALRIATLDIVEVYLDTAITALHALNQLGPLLNEDPNLGCRIEIEPSLDEGPGVRHRLDDTQGASYWPRMIISDFDRNDEDCPPECFEAACPPDCFQEPCDCEEQPGAPQREGAPKPAPKSSPAWLRRRLAPADRLRFLFIGTRARAESIVQQRQPGLVERLVDAQVSDDRYHADFSRTLFQLLLPNDFKDAARQIRQVVLVLDRYTADLPWELMLADEEPLAVKAAMVRQLKSARFRARVRQAPGQRAYVVGNPSTAGFVDAFPGLARRRDDGGLTDLPGAEAEAQAVAQTLLAQGFQVTRAIGASARAIDVLSALYKTPYRILHVAAHGVFELPAADGKPRSGVCLSDGLLITAAEVQAMEIVPELVFVNCCHLGRVQGTAFNRLAHSLSRELIEIGVRAVVVAAWAVDDRAARAFAERFYRELLERNACFGHAVLEARREVYQQFPSTITWGAYQAYCGDPGWVFDLKRESSTESSPGEAGPARRPPVAPEELVDRLTQTHLSIFRRRQPLSRNDAKRIAADTESELVLADQGGAPKRGPYRTRADVSLALGQLFLELGPEYYDRARGYFEQVLHAPRSEYALPPIRAIELLAHAEAAHAAREPDGSAAAAALAEPAARDAAVERDFTQRLELVERAISRLTILQKLVEFGATEAVDTDRLALLASAHKRQAAIRARHYARTSGNSSSELTAMRDALALSSREYGKAAGVGSGDAASGSRPHYALNWLFLELLKPEQERSSDFERLARGCAESVLTEYGRDPSFWNTVIAAEVLLFEKLRAEPSARSQAGFTEGLPDAENRVEDPARALGIALDELSLRYREALDASGVSPKQLETVLSQIRCLRDFYEAEATALGLNPKPGVSGVPNRSSIAMHLNALVNRLAPTA